MCVYHKWLSCTMCVWCSDWIYRVTQYIKWGTMSWTYRPRTLGGQECQQVFTIVCTLSACFYENNRQQRSLIGWTNISITLIIICYHDWIHVFHAFSNKLYFSACIRCSSVFRFSWRECNHFERFRSEADWSAKQMNTVAEHVVAEMVGLPFSHTPAAGSPLLVCLPDRNILKTDSRRLLGDYRRETHRPTHPATTASQLLTQLT